MFVKLLLHYTRGAKERQFLRELLQPLVKSVIHNSSLDLEVDPLAVSIIYIEWIGAVCFFSRFAHHVNNTLTLSLSLDL